MFLKFNQLSKIGDRAIADFGVRARQFQFKNEGNPLSFEVAVKSMNPGQEGF
ncbi:hypothetical protein JJD41_05895 [Oxynema sp. CENA135]|uniref:hypothetical protein n=1 Tax=Oxynema sp. CENA135 TaxID=984206 RepID=UPI00190E2C7E|nr:hypothetical protein [Oxynema sp. CENA135]MBK4729419.1 hypothetical protein [Oxynema sp. CENA135]